MPSDQAFLDSLAARQLCPDLDVGAFECGQSAIDWYLREAAREHHDSRITSVMCWASQDGDVAGYVTTSMHLIEIESPDQRLEMDLKHLVRTEGGKLVKRFPALLIGMLGVCTRYKGRGLGKYMVKHAIGQAHSLSRTIGCRLVAVDSDKTTEALALYRSVGFTEIDNREARRGTRHTVEMYFDLGPLYPRASPASSSATTSPTSQT